MPNPLITQDLTTTTSNLEPLVAGHLEDTGGLLRLSPTRVHRSFLQPGLRIMQHPAATAMGGCKNA